MDPAQPLVKKGDLLLAEPFMWDPNFRRAVVLVCGHTEEEGTYGLVVNRPLDIRINEIVEDFPELDAQVYLGGPVENNRLNFLHELGDLIEDADKVAPGIWLGGNFDQLKFLAANGLVKPDNVRFIVGYAGWEPGQLAEEMADRSWIVAPSDPNYFFRKLKMDMWELAMKNKGDTFSIMSEMPDMTSWN